MTFDVILLKQTGNGYLARPLLWPDKVVHGNTKQEALDGVRELIRSLIGQTQFVKVDVDLPEQSNDHFWLAKAGLFADDPSWDDFLTSMSEYRRHLDEEHTPVLI
ncbi:MAG: hypothetical protein IAE85_02280 [Anaerolinea sp.]|nr:hypothetical protein [Anaerolinea sp.]